MKSELISASPIVLCTSIEKTFLHYGGMIIVSNCSFVLNEEVVFISVSERVTTVWDDHVVDILFSAFIAVGFDPSLLPRKRKISGMANNDYYFTVPCEVFTDIFTDFQKRLSSALPH